MERKCSESSSPWGQHPLRPASSMFLPSIACSSYPVPQPQAQSPWTITTTKKWGGGGGGGEVSLLSLKGCSKANHPGKDRPKQKDWRETSPPPAFFQLSRVNGEFSYTYVVHAFLGVPPPLLRNRKGQRLDGENPGWKVTNPTLPCPVAPLPVSSSVPGLTQASLPQLTLAYARLHAHFTFPPGQAGPRVVCGHGLLASLQMYSHMHHKPRRGRGSPHSGQSQASQC